MTLHHLSINNQQIIFWGPSLDKGPLPAVFYYALSAEDSLTLSPFNQPITYLKDFASSLPLRIFSVTLPGHEPPLQKEKALEYWAHEFSQGNDPLGPFIQSQVELIDTLVAMELVQKNKIILSGLSRGGLVACLVAAKQPLCHHVLGFAPLTKLSYAKEFHALSNHPAVTKYHVNQHISALAPKKIRFYIGNHDTRVNTGYTFEVISALAEYAHAHRLKTCSHELHISNSIGYQGHGTSEKTFKEGALWMFEELFYHE